MAAPLQEGRLGWKGRQPGGLWLLAPNYVGEESREELTEAGRQSCQCAYQAAGGSV